MKHLTRISAFAAALVTFAMSGSAQQVEDNCAEVLRLAGRDETLVTRRLIAAKYIYDQYCSGSATKQGVNLSLGVSEMLESFDLGFGSVDQRVSQLCKTYSEHGFTDEASLTRSSLVVRDAIEAWKQCKALSAREFKVVPQAGDTSFNVDFVQGTGRPVTINGVFYPDAAADCFAKIGQAPSVRVARNTVVTIQNAIPWAVTCIRKPQKATGETIYPAFEFSVPTSGLTFRMSIPRTSLPSYATVKEVASAIADVQTQLKMLPQSLDIDCVTIYTDTRGKSPAVSSCPAGYVVTGCTAGSNLGTIDNMTADQCIKTQAVDWVIARCCKVKQRQQATQ